MFQDDFQGVIDMAIEVAEQRSSFGGFRYACEVARPGIETLADDLERNEMGQAEQGNLHIFQQATGALVAVVMRARGNPMLVVPLRWIGKGPA